MSEQFDAIFTRLRGIMLGAAPGLVVAKDEHGALEVRTNTIDPKTKEPGWFGIVTIKKSYVAYHLMPIYTQPSLASAISLELAKRRQGKSCFNFKQLDEQIFSELEILSRKCAETIG